MNTVEEAIAAYREGRFVVVLDDEDRENEGDLILAAQHATPERIAFLVRHTSGIVCVAIPSERARELDLPLMVTANTECMRTAFTVSVDLKHGTTTGISASDRAATLRALASPELAPGDLLRPGHVFPLIARPGGVLKRAGHTEAAVDLARLSGLAPAGALCEIVSEDGTQMARRAELEAFALAHDLPIITVADLIRYRRRTEKIVEHVSDAALPTSWGLFRCHAYRSLLDGIEHVAFVKGEVRGKENVLVRVQSECLTGEVFRSLRCDCGAQLDGAMRLLSREEAGVLVYLRGHEGRGIGICNKMRAYDLQDRGRDTVDANTELGLPADAREYGVGAHILSDLGVSTLRLLTNNPRKYGGLEGYGLRITERMGLLVEPCPDNVEYLRTKQERMGHLLGDLTDAISIPSR